MVRQLLFAAIVLHAAAAYAADRVQYETRITPIRTEDERQQWCGNPTRIQACTRFISLRFAATPNERDGAWRLNANASFIALIGLQDTTRYGHEMKHVRDMESSINAYLASLEGEAFSTREACEQARSEAVKQFEARVRSFAEASNLFRDGSPHPDR